MSRLMVLGMLPLAALAASEGAKGSNTLSGATKAESGASARGLFPTWNKDEQNNGDQRRRGLGWWGGANGKDIDTGLQTRQLQATGGGCGDGIAGVRSSGGDGNICCSEECGVCGGPGCSTVGGDGFDDSHCCVSAISTSGRMCDETGEAPCILSDDGGGGNEPGDKDGDGGIDGFAYRGCYVVEGSDPFTEVFEDGAMTPELCFDTCALSSSLYMGLLKGNECGCGGDSSFLASNKEDGVCDENCPGDEVQTCGGVMAYDLFELMDTDPTDDLVDEDSTCDGGIPGVQSANGNVCCVTACGICDGSSCVGYGDCCEEKIQDSGVLCSDSGAAPCIFESDDFDRASPEDEMSGYLYVGCFEESSYDPFTSVSQINKMTIRLCSESCGAMGAAYAGVMDGDVCGCGSEDGYLDAAKEGGTCLTDCAGDDGRTEICGGSTSFGLMRIIYGGTAIVNSMVVDGAPSPAPALVAELNSDAAGAVVAAPADAPASSDPSVLTAYTHLGCFGFEMGTNPFFSLVQMDNMTYHMCSEACGLLGGVYVGVIGGDTCGCGSEDGYLTSLKPAGTCDVQCAGIAGDTDTCGGSTSFDLFLINYLANDDDFFGSEPVPYVAGPSTSGGHEEGYAGSTTSDVDSTDDAADADPAIVASGDNSTDWETGQAAAAQAVAATMTGFQYSGCFEIEADHDPFSFLVQMDDMTLTTCNEFCGTKGATYSGAMDGDMCGCGSEEGYLALEKDAGLCLIECAGDDGRIEICGGSSSFDLFEIIYMVEDGTGASDGSEASSVLSADPASASASEVVVDKYEMTGYIFDGCYPIEANFDPFSSLMQIDAMTRRSCSEFCGSTGADYAGAMDGDLCGCGSVAGYLETGKEDGSCLMECAGDDGRTEMCGGSASFDLFEIFYAESKDAAGNQP